MRFAYCALQHCRAHMRLPRPTAPSESALPRGRGEMTANLTGNNMRTSFVTGLSALALATFFATPAAAAELGGGFSVNGGATVVSDYRFRGISQTDKDFALQGTISVSHKSGFYATVWGSSIDDY